MEFDARKYTLRIEGKKLGRPIELDGGKDNPFGLDISFNVRFNCTGVCREGTVSITGLSRNNINKFICLSVLSEAGAAKEEIYLTLFAGYESTCLTQIISGIVVRAQQSPPPELKLTLTVKEVYAGVGSKEVEFGVSQPDKLKIWLKLFMEKYGIKFKFDKNYFGTHKSVFEENVTLPNRRRTISEAIDSIRMIPASFNFCWQTCVSGNTLWIYDTDRREYFGKLPKWTLSEETGLLGVSGIDHLKVRFTAFLQDLWGDRLPYVKLESTYNPQANGTYFITGVNYVGNFRGTEWYTKADGIRITK